MAIILNIRHWQLFFVSISVFHLLIFILATGDYICKDFIKQNFNKPDEVFLKCNSKLEVLKFDSYDFNVFKNDRPIKNVI